MKFWVKRYWELSDSVQVEADSVARAVEAAHALPLDYTRAEFVPESMNTDTFIDVKELSITKTFARRRTFGRVRASASVGAIGPALGRATAMIPRVAIRYCVCVIHMTSLQLPNHLRANRKQLALSQDEVAFLLGANSGGQVCRNERFVREPNLQTALAYEAIYKRSVSELFPGLYQKVEQEVAERAKVLISKSDRTRPTRQTARKREALVGLLNN